MVGLSLMTSLCRSFRLSITVLLCVLMSNALPDGFIVETVSSDVKKGITGIFIPNPGNSTKPHMMLIVSKRGTVTLLENPDESSEVKTILNLAGKLCTNGERGLQSIAVHPNFTENRYIYLFYTARYIEDCPEGAEDGTWNVVERFVMDPVTYTLDYDSREEIWRTSPLYEEIHNGGAMDFGTDGKLYITTGDSGRKAMAKQLDNVLGSIIRLNEDGSVPDDNPFTDQNGYDSSYRCADTGGVVPENVTDDIDAICSEVFGYGFRNPFRMAMDKSKKDKVVFSVSDVGSVTFEELSLGGSDYPGRNYNWPDLEGPCKENSISDCPIPTDESAMEPFHFYQHRVKKEGGAAAGQVFVPANIWPSQYKFLFIDFIFLEIYNLIENPDQGCRSCSPPVSGYRNETFFKSVQRADEHVNNARMVEMFFGPYKNTTALYILRYGQHDSLIRIRYNGILNAPPLVNFTVPNQIYALGADVQFNGSISSDPEGDALTFDWDFGNGATSNETNPVHYYENPGEYTITLKVSDTYGQIQQKSDTVVVGDPPTANLISPIESDTFFVGEMLQLQGEAYDHTGAKLNDTQLSWEVRKHHADHFHPFMDITFGNNISLYPAPAPEDFFATTNSYFRIILYATDNDGLTTEVHRIVQPTLVAVDVETNPQGLTVTIDDYRVKSSDIITSWKEHDLRLKVEDQEASTFIGWSDGNINRERTVRLSDDVQTIQANFCGDIGRRCTLKDECCSGYCIAYECVPKSPGLSTLVSASGPTTGSTASPTSEPTLTPTSSSSIALDQNNNVITSFFTKLNWNWNGNWNEDILEKTLVGVLIAFLIVMAFCVICCLKRRLKMKNNITSPPIPSFDNGLKDVENYSTDSLDPNNITMISASSSDDSYEDPTASSNDIVLGADKSIGDEEIGTGPFAATLS